MEILSSHGGEKKNSPLIQCGYTHCHPLSHTQLLCTAEEAGFHLFDKQAGYIRSLQICLCSRLNKPSSFKFSAQPVLQNLTNLALPLTCSDLSILPVVGASKLVAVFPIWYLPLIVGHGPVVTAQDTVGLWCCWGTLLAYLQLVVCQDPPGVFVELFHSQQVPSQYCCKRFFCVPDAGEMRTKFLPVVFTCTCCPGFILTYPFPLYFCS